MGKLKQVAISEFFLKNKHQLGFGAAPRATLTAVKEAVDNSLDACEDARILPNIKVEIKKIRSKNQKIDILELTVYDNGPGISSKNLGAVFGQLLVGSKFHSNKQQRGQQGIGIAAACMYGLATTATPAEVFSKQKKDKKVTRQVIKMNTKTNQPQILQNEQTSHPWFEENESGTIIKIQMDGKMQKGDRGVEYFLTNTALVNPHLSLSFHLPDEEPVILERTLEALPNLSKSTLPHVHAIELGTFLDIINDEKNQKVKDIILKSFVRMSDGILRKLPADTKKLLQKKSNPTEAELKRNKDLKIKSKEIEKIYEDLKEIDVPSPPTNVLSPIGYEGLLCGIQRIGEPEFVEVVSRKPTICSNSAFQVEVCLAAFSSLEKNEDDLSSVKIHRFANKVPLQFRFNEDGIVHAIKKVDWKNYGISQKKGNIPDGPYVFLVSIIGSWLPFSNAAKEAIEPIDELVEEIKLALQEAGRKLSRHVKAKKKRHDTEKRVQELNKFGPHVVLGIQDILGLTEAKKKKLDKSLTSLLSKPLEAYEEEVPLSAIERFKQNQEKTKKPKKKKAKKRTRKKS